MQKVTQHLTIAGALTADGLKSLAAKGYRTVVDLRGDCEVTRRGLEPCQEHTLVTTLGMEYRQVPIELRTFDYGRIASVRQLLRTAQGPVLLHCASGRRAAALALIFLCCDRGTSLGDCFTRAQTLDIGQESAPGLCDLWMAYIRRHRQEYRGRAGAEGWSV